MRRAVICLLLLGLLPRSVTSDESASYRGQTAAQWQQQLSHPSPSARAAAAQAFVQIGQGHENAVEPLIGLLSDRDERVRFYAAYALGKIQTRHERCLQALIEALPDKDEHARYAAQWALAEIARQVAKSTDKNLPVSETLKGLLAEAETQLLTSGALRGHLQQVRAAMARVQPPVADLALTAPATDASREASHEIESCLQSLASGEVLAQAKATEQLRRLGLPCVEQLFDSPTVLASLGNVDWQLPSTIASLGEPVVPVLVKALRQADFATSDLAARTLRELGPLSRSALPDLVAMLESDETTEDVRQRTLGILIGMGPAAGNATDILVRILNDVQADEEFRQSAAEALGAIGPGASRAVPALIERLQDSELPSYVQAELASALVRIAPHSEDVIRSLVAAVHESEDIFDAVCLAEHLCKCGPGAAALVPWLIEAVDESSFDERATVLRLLGQLGAERVSEVGPCLCARLMDPSEELMVQVAAAKGIGALGPVAVQMVIDKLQTGDDACRLLAARTLVEIDSAASPAKAVLYELLLERAADNELRSLAAVALGQLGAAASDTAPGLTEVLRDPESDSYLRSMCAVALGQVDSSALPVLESMLDASEAEVQIASAYSLCRIEPCHSRGLPTLVHWLASEEHRESAMRALVDLGAVTSPLIIETMHDASLERDTRIACLQVLGEFRDQPPTPLLEALNDHELAAEAGFALRDRGNELLPSLVASIDDEVRFNLQAREILGNVIEDLFTGMGEGGGEEAWEGGHPLVRRPEPSAMRMAAAMEAPMMAMEATPSDLEAAREALNRALIGATQGNHPDATLATPPKLEQGLGEGEDAAVVEAEAPFAEPSRVAVGYKTVDVFYGTNRQPIDESVGAHTDRGRWVWWIGGGAVCLLVGCLVGMYRRGAIWQATAGLAGITLLLLLGLLLFAPIVTRPPIDKSGPRYGGDYSERVEMGICQVTIPDTHREGELEAPTLLRLQIAEDLRKHIVLRNVERLNKEAFFTGLQHELQRQGNSILVFIHGYNVSFEDAARRTAQMSSDLKFAGAPVFYSWPSQADWRKYRVDEKNVELSVDQLKTFLLAIAQHSRADTINLVAHSMGNRALTDALKEMDDSTATQSPQFNQVILAAPDIDADIFKQRIAPAIVSKAKHITLYASSRDLALVASRTFNSGDPRAGDAGSHLVVLPGIETIDVSHGDSSLLGHSYYGDNVSVLRDIEFLLRDQPASSRRFLEPVSLHDNLTYWLFQPPRIARRLDQRDEPRKR